MKTSEINILALAYLGDSIYEIVYRARNHKGNRHPKNTDILTYKHATALEALIGYWYLEKKFKRLEEVMRKILEETICTYMEKM